MISDFGFRISEFSLAARNYRPLGGGWVEFRIPNSEFRIRRAVLP
jgi:hypothetical protein